MGSFGNENNARNVFLRRGKCIFLESDFWGENCNNLEKVVERRK
jgi:hypothetical protein